jgi:hypothetical protein
MARAQPDEVRVIETEGSGRPAIVLVVNVGRGLEATALVLAGGVFSKERSPLPPPCSTLRADASICALVRVSSARAFFLAVAVFVTWSL